MLQISKICHGWSSKHTNCQGRAKPKYIQLVKGVTALLQQESPAAVACPYFLDTKPIVAILASWLLAEKGLGTLPRYILPCDWAHKSQSKTISKAIAKQTTFTVSKQDQKGRGPRHVLQQGESQSHANAFYYPHLLQSTADE
jgi:hypothetical protein